MFQAGYFQLGPHDYGAQIVAPRTRTSSTSVGRDLPLDDVKDPTARRLGRTSRLNPDQALFAER
jgi:hypothetical protein